MVNIFFPPNTWQMITFLNPLDVLIPKISFSISFFAEFGVRITSGAWGSVSVGFGGGRERSPFGRRGGVGLAREGCTDHPANDSPPTAAYQRSLHRVCIASKKRSHPCNPQASSTRRLILPRTCGR